MKDANGNQHADSDAAEDSVDAAIGRPEPWGEGRYQREGEVLGRAVSAADRPTTAQPQSTPVTAKDYEELAPPAACQVTNALAGIAVGSLEAARVWYSKLFGWPANSTSIPQVAEWKFERGGGLQIFQLPERAGKGSVSLSVANLEAHIAHLRQLGIDPGLTMQNAEAKVIMIKDPDGNSLAFSEANDCAIAR